MEPEPEPKPEPEPEVFDWWNQEKPNFLIEQDFKKNGRSKKILAHFSLGENDLNFLNPRFFYQCLISLRYERSQDTKLS